MGDVIELGTARVEVEQRPGYLYMVEHGHLLTRDEVQAYAGAIELVVERTGCAVALIDARGSEGGEPTREARDAMWSWLTSGRALKQIAFVMANEMTVARVNMTALSSGARIRAFGSVHEAHRWLSGRQRTASQAFVAPTSVPPPPPGAPRTPAGVTGRFGAAPSDSGFFTPATEKIPARPSSRPPSTRRSDVVPVVDPDAPDNNGHKGSGRS